MLVKSFLVNDNGGVVRGVYVPVRQDPRKMRYIEWLTTVPEHRVPRTEKELAVELDTYYRTLYGWKQQKDFREVWHDEAEGVIGNPDKRQAVLEVLFQAATNARNPRHVQAAKLYFEATGAIAPPKVEVALSTKALSMLDEDELDRLIARGVAEMKAEGDARREDGLPAADHPG